MWIRLDVDFPSHPKARSAGLEGRALFVASLCYAGRHLTDGVIERSAVPVLLAEAEVKPRAVERLVGAGLWEPIPVGYRIHDWELYQPAAVLQTARAARAAVGGRARAATARRGEHGRFAPATDQRAAGDAGTSGRPATDQRPPAGFTSHDHDHDHDHDHVNDQLASRRAGGDGKNATEIALVWSDLLGATAAPLNPLQVRELGALGARAAAAGRGEWPLLAIEKAARAGVRWGGHFLYVVSTLTGWLEGRGSPLGEPRAPAADWGAPADWEARVARRLGEV